MTEKQRKCKFYFQFMRDDAECCKKGKVSEEDCETCTDYKCKYIEYPLTIQGIDIEAPKKDTAFASMDCGRLAKIRPCGKEYGDKTYLGIYLGRLPYSPNVMHNTKENKLIVSTMTNPAIFVPSLKRIIFGMESWWGFIDDESELKDITDTDIDSQWYVQLIKSVEKGEKDVK